jgi:hypothetical protein
VKHRWKNRQLWKVKNKSREIDKTRLKVIDDKENSSGNSLGKRKRRRWKFRGQKVNNGNCLKIQLVMVYFNEEAMSNKGYIKLEQDIEYVKRKDEKENLESYWSRRKLKSAYTVIEAVGLKCYTSRKAPIISISGKRRIKNTEISSVFVESDVDPMEVTKIKIGIQFDATPIYCHKKSIMFFSRLIQRRKKHVLGGRSVKCQLLILPQKQENYVRNWLLRMVSFHYVVMRFPIWKKSVNGVNTIAYDGLTEDKKGLLRIKSRNCQEITGWLNFNEELSRRMMQLREEVCKVEGLIHDAKEIGPNVEEVISGF